MQRGLEQRVPRLVIAHERAQLGARAKRLDQRREHGPRDAADHLVELLPRSQSRGIAGDGFKRGPRGAAIARIEQQPGAGALPRVGRVRGHAAPRESQRQGELAHDRRGQQAHEVGVARDARFQARKDLFGDGSAAERGAALEHQARAPRPCQVGARGEPVVAATDDDRVVCAARIQTAGQ